MSFGSPTPVEVAVTGRTSPTTAPSPRSPPLSRTPSLRDLQYGLSLDYPTISIEIDRECGSAASPPRIARSSHPHPPAASWSRITGPTRRPASASRSRSRTRSWTAREGGDGADPQAGPGPAGPAPRRGAGPPGDERRGEYDRYNMRCTVSLTANIFGEDLGGLPARRSSGSARRPRGDRRLAEIVPMEEILRGLATAWGCRSSQPARGRPTSSRCGRPGGGLDNARGGGVVVMLWLTGTTINLQSFMGAIMAIGVAVANAILLVTFAEEHRRVESANAARAAVEAGRGRLRPILMTSCDDRRHGAAAPGWGEGRADRPARPCRHRRPGRSDARHPDPRPAHGFRPGSEQGRPGVGLLDPDDPESAVLPRGGTRNARAGAEIHQRPGSGPSAQGLAVP